MHGELHMTRVLIHSGSYGGARVFLVRWPKPGLSLTAQTAKSAEVVYVGVAA